MVQASAAHQDTERKEKWDAFLDAYSVYLRDPSMANAASPPIDSSKPAYQRSGDTGSARKRRSLQAPTSQAPNPRPPL